MKDVGGKDDLEAMFVWEEEESERSHRVRTTLGTDNTCFTRTKYRSTSSEFEGGDSADQCNASEASTALQQRAQEPRSLRGA